MKLLAILSFLISFQVQAASLKSNDIYISGEVVSAKPLCPQGMQCFVDGTMLELKFLLPNNCYSISEFGYKVFSNSQSVEVTAVQSEPANGKVCAQLVTEVH